MAAKFFFVASAAMALFNIIAAVPCAPAWPAATIGGCGLGGAYNAIGGCGLGGAYNAIGGCGLGGAYNAIDGCGLGGAYNAIGGCGLGGAYNAIGGYGLGAGYNAIGGCGLGGSYNAVAVDNGGALGVISASALAPSGVSIVSDNAIEGIVDIVGAAPVLSAVAFEGNLPTAGSAGTAYSCGNGNVGISGESLAAAGLGAASGLAGYGLGANAALANAAYGNAAWTNAGLAGINAGRLIAPGAGCGCGGIYY